MNVRLALTAFFLFGSIAVAQTPDPCATAPQGCATLIETHATSQMRLANTAVDVVVSITVAGKDLATVERSLADKSNSLTAYLVAQKAKQLVTSRMSFTSQMRFDKEKPSAYDGGATVSFRTAPGGLADILAGVLTNGADSIRSTTFTPTEQEIADARRQLAEDATRTAVSQADAIAKAAGLHVVSIRNINVADSGSVMPQQQVYIDGFTGGNIARKDKQLESIGTASGEDGISVRVDVIAAATH
jgi:uncharacterized protein YggE